MQLRSLALAALAAALSAPLIAQESIGTFSGNRMYRIDHDVRSATLMTQKTAELIGHNCILMTDATHGFVGTVGNPADIWAITLGGTGNNDVTGTKLNTSATAGGNCAQLALVRATLYFTTQTGASGKGTLQSMPAAGGAVTNLLDLSTVTGAGASLANGLCAIGGKIYVGGFDSGTTAANAGEIIVYDIETKKSEIFAKLPQGKFNDGTNDYNVGIVNMAVGRAEGHSPVAIVAQGVYGDILYFGLDGKLLLHEFTGFPKNASAAARRNLQNAFAWDPQHHHWIMGSRNSSIEVAQLGRSAENVIVVPVAGSFSGLHHFPRNEDHGFSRGIGTGCEGNGGFTATSFISGNPKPGWKGLAINLYSGDGTAKGCLLLSASPQIPPIDLKHFGITPDCFLRVGLRHFLEFPVVLQGTGFGGGFANVTFDVPRELHKIAVWSQFFALQVGGKTNATGVTVSSAVMTVFLDDD